MIACSKCSELFEPRPWQSKHRVCLPCISRRRAAWRQARKAAGRPVQSSKVWDEAKRLAWKQTYNDKPGVRARKAERQRAYFADPALRLRHKARRTAQEAVLGGKLKREPCEQCGAMPVHAHHDDYSKPLVVRWLCAPCHRAHHLKAKVTP